MNLNEELTILLLDNKQAKRKRLLENLLNGKRTVATLYWALRYNLLGYLGVGKYLGTTDLNLNSLIEQKLVQKNKDNYQLTTSGMKLKNKFLASLDNNWQSNFQKINIMTFKYRLILFIQVISEFAHQENNYYPVKIPESEMMFVKNYFLSLNREGAVTELRDELNDFFRSISDLEANIMANELIGYQNNGKTIFQISELFHEPKIAVYFLDLDIISKLINFSNKRKQSIIRPLLRGLKKDLISKGATLTLNQYRRIQNTNQIAKQRHLKESTILEHLLESAIYVPINNFPYSDFVTSAQIELLKEQLGVDIDQWQYESITEEEKKDITFFQFRLIEIYLTKIKAGD